MATHIKYCKVLIYRILSTRVRYGGEKATASISCLHIMHGFKKLKHEPYIKNSYVLFIDLSPCLINIHDARIWCSKCYNKSAIAIF